MFLNNWKMDLFFSLDTLKGIPRPVGDCVCFTLVNDKSGFDNLRLAADSADLVGFQWAGYYFDTPFWFQTKLIYIYIITR